jgi:hypothetical protein
MAGRLARDAPHLDGTEPIAVWFDVAWATYADLLTNIDQDQLDFMTERWEEIGADHDLDQPTMDTWGTSERAQHGQAALMAMLGGPGAMGADSGASPGIGEG